MRLYFDTETNGLLEDVTTVHSLVIEDLDTGERWSFADQGDYPDINEGIILLEQADVLVGHNIQGYDIPVLKKIYPGFNPKAKVRDTLILSRLIWPDIGVQDKKRKNFLESQTGKHSLEAWGFRLGVRKGNYGNKKNAWEKWTPEMQEYCEQDVTVGVALWRKIEALNYSETAIELEHEFAAIMRMQEEFGFPFHAAKAEKLTAMLLGRRAELLPQLREAFPATVVTMKTPEFWTGYVTHRDGVSETLVSVAFKTKGDAQKARAKKIKPGPLRKKIIPFDPNSRTEIAKRLLKMGWVPNRFTDTGKPKTDDEALEEALETLHQPEIDILREYLTVQKRIGQIAEGPKAWLKLVKPDGRMHGGVITNGAVTGRCSHVDPNMAQVPALKSRTGKTQPYGKECRELFYAPDGWVLVGVDASGLELRCLAHFMARYDGGEYVKVVTTGDVHTTNQKAAGLDSRPKAKTFIYAYIYGAGDWKLGFTAELVDGEIVNLKVHPAWQKTVKGLTRRHLPADDITVALTVKGSILRAQFETGLPALKQLKAAMEQKITELTPRGYRRLKADATIKGLDGRIVPIRSKHSALNTLLQGAGAILMKKATVILYQKLIAKGWKFGQEFAFVAHVHDELQILARLQYAEEIGKLFNTSLQEAGEFFNFRCPLAGEYKIGSDWASTH